MDIHALATQINPATDIPPATKKVLVPVADGTEEMEAVIVIDVLRRAGATVTVASVEDGRKQIIASRSVNILADCLISDCEDVSYDLVVLPGGMPGSEHLRDSQLLKKITENQVKENRLFAAICAAPVVALQAWGLLKGLHATCHPSFGEKLEDKVALESEVVRDSFLTTSRGPGTAFLFALALVERLYGAESVPAVSGPMVLPVAEDTDLTKLVFNDQDWSMESTPEVLVPVANGSEEMEAVIIIDILRRAGAKVVVASVETDTTIKASRNVQLVADKLISEVVETKFDLVVLPGGMPGADRLKQSEELTKILKEQSDEGRPYGAICAAPAVVLDAHGLLQGKKATSHPAFSSGLADQSAVEGRVVIDGRVITSRGPGTAMEFTLSIVEKLFSAAKAQEIADAMVFDYLSIHAK
jgi:4-methyl-5(b-hydroxyethyl)-thiazole monophosphate biosynthesis